MGFFSEIKDHMNWNAMQRLGIRQTQDRMQCCEMCSHFRDSNESCSVFNVVVNKAWWICGNYSR